MVYTLVCHVEVREDCIDKMVKKLKESSEIYRRDEGTIDWIVSQDVNDPKKFGIVERFESKYHTKFHLENPYWASWNPQVEPWLAKPIEMHEFNEL